MGRREYLIVLSEDVLIIKLLRKLGIFLILLLPTTKGEKWIKVT